MKRLKVVEEEEEVFRVPRTLSGAKYSYGLIANSQAQKIMSLLGTSVSPGSNFDTPSPSKKQMLGGIGLRTTFETTRKDYGQQQRERDDEEPLPEAKSLGA